MKKDFGAKAWVYPMPVLIIDNGVPWIDCQVYTDHLARFGAREISRSEYLQMLSAAFDCHK